MTERTELRERLVEALESVAPSAELSRRVSVRVVQRQRRRRAAGAAAAVAVLAAVVASAGLLVGGGDDDRQVFVGDPAEPLRWEVLADAPIPPRAHPAGVWTGREVIFWGGGDTQDSRSGLRADGAAFDPATGSWRMLPDAPVGPRAGHQAVWTGEEMVVWGGWRPGDQQPSGYADGAAYNPDTNTWRAVSENPVGPRLDAAAVWTGQEMVVLGGFSGGPGVDAVGAAYDPASDRWRLLPPIEGLAGHTEAWAAWTGEEILYWRANSTVVGGTAAGPELFSYRPDTDRWTRLRSPTSFELAWGHAVLAWTGRQLVAASGTIAGGRDWWEDAEAVAYDPATNQWERITLTRNTEGGLVTPLNHTPAVAWTGREVIAMAAVGVAASALDPATGDWELLPARPPGLDWPTLVTAHRGDVYAWGAHATARLTRATDR